MIRLQTGVPPVWGGGGAIPHTNQTFWANHWYHMGIY